MFDAVADHDSDDDAVDDPTEERPVLASFQATGNVLTGSDQSNLIKAGLDRLSPNTKVYTKVVKFDQPVPEYRNPLLYYAFAPSAWTLARGGPELPTVDPALPEADQDACVRSGQARYVNISFNLTVRRVLESTFKAFAEHYFWNFGILNVALRRHINQNARFVLKHSPHHNHTIAEVITAFEENESDPTQQRHNKVIGMLRHAVDVICRAIPGTPAHRAGFRTHIVGTTASYGPAFLWVTLSPAAVHSIKCVRLTGGGLHVHLDVPASFPNATDRTKKTVGNPVATARFYERMLKHYFDAFVNWPWNLSCARGPGIFGWAEAYNATTEMQRGGMLHLHMLLHCTINMARLSEWLIDPVNQQAFFAHVDSLQDAQLPEALHFATKNDRGYPILTQNQRTNYLVRVGECTVRNDRLPAGGNSVYASSPEPLLQNHSCYPPARVQHHFKYPTLEDPFCVIPSQPTWVGVLGADATSDQIGELVENPTTHELGVRICTLDVATTGGRTLPMSDRVVRFDHVTYQTELGERGVLTTIGVGLHTCHPHPPKDGFGCFVKGMNCKSGAPWVICPLGERWLLASGNTVVPLRSDFKEVTDVSTIPDTVPFTDWVDISTAPLSTLPQHSVLEVTPDTAMRFDVQARPRDPSEADMPGWPVGRIAALWYPCNVTPAKLAAVIPMTIKAPTADLTTLDQHARTAKVKLHIIDVLKLKHRTYTLHADTAENSAWPYAFVLHAGDRFWPLTARPDSAFTIPPVPLLNVAAKALPATIAQALRATRAFTTYLYASSLDAHQIDAVHQRERETAAEPSSDLSPRPPTQYVFYYGTQHTVSINRLASTLEGFNQCVRVLAGEGLEQVLTMYMTVYMTKTGFTETKLNELYLAALKRMVQYKGLPTEPGISTLDFLRKQATTCAISTNRNFSVSAPYASLLNLNRNPHFSSHTAVFLPLHWFVNSGKIDAFVLTYDELHPDPAHPDDSQAETLTGACARECTGPKSIPAPAPHL
jgi:hypothetical protein